MKTVVTVSEIVNIIRRTVNGTMAITVDLDSPVDGKMRKTGNPFVNLGIVKRETLNGMVGYNYGAAVNRLAKKEGAEERQAKPHGWGDMDEKRLFRIHRTTGKPYLSMMLRSAVVHGFFYPDGSEVVADKITPFIPEKKKSSTQADLEGEVIALDYNLDNVRGMRFNGSDYEVIPDGVVVPQKDIGQPTNVPVAV